jgi:hypothetical protein
MTNDDREPFEDRVTEALGAYADRVEPSEDAWEGVQVRARRRSARVVVPLVAAVLVVALGVAGAVALSGDDGDVRVGTDTTTSPSTSAPATTTSAAPTTTTTIPPTTTTQPSIFDDAAMVTAWQPIYLDEWDDFLRTALGDGAESPEAAAESIGAWMIEGTLSDVPIEVHHVVIARDETTAAVELTLRRLPDDSVGGLDYRLAMYLGPNGWLVSGGESRSVCSRGVDTAQNVCV